MATLQQRSGKWHVRIRRKGFKTQSETFNSKAEALRWARKTEADLDQLQRQPQIAIEAVIGDPPFDTLGELLEVYQERCTTYKKGAYKEAKRIEALNRSALASVRLTELRKSIFSLYRDSRRFLGLSDDTIRREFDIVSAAITWAQTDLDLEWLPNPVRAVCKTLKPPALNQRNRRLSWWELKRLLEAARGMGSRGSLIGPVIKLAIRTAMRRSEIAGLNWSQVNLRSQLIQLDDTKNGYSRTVPLSSKAVLILTRLKGKDTAGSVFNMRADSITQAFSRACQSAGLTDLRFHDLRHEATSQLFEHGLNTMEVLAVTGHRTLQMLKRYTHLRPTELVKKLG